MRSIGTPGGCFATLWQTRGDAEQSWERVQAPVSPPPDALFSHDGIYEVRHSVSGASPADTPSMAHVVWFTGPRSEAQAAADDLACNRILPVVTKIDGTVATWVLRGDDLSQVIIALTTGLEVIEKAVDTRLRTELLPGEEPGLVPVPDAVELYRVRAYAAAKVPVATG
jgi:hypothetical protein